MTAVSGNHIARVGIGPSDGHRLRLGRDDDPISAVGNRL